MLFHMPINKGQQFIYSASYIEERNNYALEQPKQKRSNSLVEEIQLFGQYIKEKI